MKKWEKFSKEQIYLFFNQAQTREQFLKLCGYNNYNTANFNQIKAAYPELNYDKFNKHIKIKYDLKNYTFGRLKVIERDMSKIGDTYWICQCECGILKSIRQQSLLNGVSQSCGCLQKEKASQNISINHPTHCKDIAGQIFNTLLAVKPTEERRNGHIVWECRCTKCGATNKYSINNLISLDANCNCSHKNSKGEEKIQQILERLKIQYEPQYTFDDLKGNKGWKLRYDFAIFKDGQLTDLIEYQGKQHFEPIEFLGGAAQYEITKENDMLKLQYAQECNIPLHLISYVDYNVINDDFILKILTN